MNFLDNTLIYLQNILKKNLILSYIFDNEICLVVRSSSILKILTFLKLHSLSQYKVLSDLCGVDYPEMKRRFEVVYNLLSINLNQRIRIKIKIDEFSTVKTCTKIFPGGNWLEREVWDMFGIFFTNNTDLRRILTDYGFEGYPLRKDFPLSGFIEVRFDYKIKKIVTEPVELSQSYRMFNTSSQWKTVSSIKQEIL